MSTIYTAAKTSNQNATPIFFVNQGLSSLAPTTISSLALLGKPFAKEVAYDGYMANIDSFVYATSIGKRVFCGALGYSKFMARKTIPLSPPLMQFITTAALSPDQEDTLVRKIGGETTKKKSGKTTVYAVPDVTENTLERIIQISNPIYNAGSDAVTPLGRRAFQFITGVIYEFLATNTYPAFTSKEDDEAQKVPEMEMNFELNTEWQVWYNMDGNKRKIGNISSSAKRIRMDEHGETAEVDDELDSDNETESVRLTTLDDVVLTAKPSPGLAENNFGSINSMPELGGIAFPYFKGLTHPDHANMKMILGKYFFRLFGSTTEECKAAFMEFRRGIGSLSTTDVGMELNHMLTGVDLALQTQSRLYIVLDGSTYRGFCLLGMRFAVFDGSRWVEAGTSSELREATRSMDPHGQAVSELVTRLNGMAVKASNVMGHDLTKKDFATASLAIGSVLSRQIPEDEVAEIDRNLRRLNFRQGGYWGMNPQNISLVLSHLASDTEVPDTVPQFIPGASADIAKREMRWLMAFGPDAPSFWNSRGQEVSLEREIQVEETVSIGTKRKVVKEFVPDVIYVTPKPVEVAYRDWIRVMTSGKIMQDYKERARNFRNIRVKADMMRREIWEKLVKASSMYQKPSESKDKGKKPLRGVDYDQAENVLELFD